MFCFYSHQSVAEFVKHTARVTGVKFSDDGKFIVSSGIDTNVCIHNMETEKSNIIKGMCQGSIYWGGGGGEASTPSTISSPPKHNYELIIIHVFCFILILIFWVQISSEELFKGIDFKIFLGEHACSQIHGPIPLMGL